MPKKMPDRDGIYARPDRPGFWGSWIDSTGRRRRKKFDAHTLTQARALLAAEKATAEKNRTLGYTQPSKEKFAGIIARYLKHQRARLALRSYQREDGIISTQLVPYFGEMKLAEIRRGDVQKYITRRSEEVSAASVVKEVNVVKHILGLAVEWELIAVNHAHRLKAPKPAAGRVRYLQPTELRAVLEACPDWLRPIAALAVSTGMRRGEILGLRWLDIDHAGNRVMLPQTKNGEGRIVYLNKLAQQALGSVTSEGTKPGDRVFSESQMVGDYVTQTFSKACREVGIVDFTFHDLRHTAASWMRMRGADIHTVAQVLGHKDLRMAARYQHLSPAFVSDAVGLLDSAFADPGKLP
jgi:integrase